MILDKIESITDEEKDELDGFIFISGELKIETATKIIEDVIKYNYKSKLNYIQFIITSPGGDLYSAFAIIDIMKWSAIPVYTLGLGMVGSAALLIFMAGKKGHRVITPDTVLLSHRYKINLTNCSQPDLKAFHKIEDWMYERMINHYIQHTNLKTKAEVEKHLLKEHDIWLTPQEALKLGIVDVIQQKRRKIL